eukprot:5388701-Prymnesium_polylepis.2
MHVRQRKHRERSHTSKQDRQNRTWHTWHVYGFRWQMYVAPETRAMHVHISEYTFTVHTYT